MWYQWKPAPSESYYERATPCARHQELNKHVYKNQKAFKFQVIYEKHVSLTPGHTTLPTCLYSFDKISSTPHTCHQVMTSAERIYEKQQHNKNKQYRMSNKSMHMFIPKGRIRRVARWASYWKSFAVSIVLGTKWWLRRQRLRWRLFAFTFAALFFGKQTTRSTATKQTSTSREFGWETTRGTNYYSALSTFCLHCSAPKDMFCAFVSFLFALLLVHNKSKLMNVNTLPPCFSINFLQYFRLTFCLL